MSATSLKSNRPPSSSSAASSSSKDRRAPPAAPPAKRRRERLMSAIDVIGRMCGITLRVHDDDDDGPGSPEDSGTALRGVAFHFSPASGFKGESARAQGARASRLATALQEVRRELTDRLYSFLSEWSLDAYDSDRAEAKALFTSRGGALRRSFKKDLSSIFSAAERMYEIDACDTTFEFTLTFSDADGESLRSFGRRDSFEMIRFMNDLETLSVGEELVASSESEREEEEEEEEGDPFGDEPIDEVSDE
jgi:hypothetical protein